MTDPHGNHHDDIREPLLAGCQNGNYGAIEGDAEVIVTNEVPLSSSVDGDDSNLLPIGSLWIVLSALFVCIFLSAFESTIVATIYTKIGSDFHKSNEVSWIATSYFLTTTAFQPMYGRLSDIFGRKTALVTAISIFLLGAVGCTFAPTLNFLIAARAFAGVGGGGLTTVSSIVMSDLIALRERGKYQGFGNAIYASASLVGAPLGGVLADHFSWRFAFGIAIPLALLALAVVSLTLTNYNLSEHAPAKSLRDRLRLIDYWGVLTLVSATTAIVLGLSLGGNVYEWVDVRVVVSLVAGLTLLGAFIVVEKKVAEYPIMPIDVLVRRTPFGCYLTVFFSSMTYITSIFMIPLYFQATQNKTATEAGLYLLPKVIFGSLGSIACGYVISHTGHYQKFTWAMCALMVLAPFGFMTLDPSRTMQAEYISYLAIDGFGFGVILTTTLVALLAATKPSEMAVANAMSYLFRALGIVLGLAISSAVVQAVLKLELMATITGPDAAWVIETARKSVADIHTLPPEYIPGVIAAYLQAIHWSFGFSALCAILALFSSFLIEDIKLSTSVKRV